MSGIEKQIAELTNQAVALLGGVTAQSYSLMGLNVSPVLPYSQITAAGFPSSDLMDKQSRKDSDASTNAIEKVLVDTSFQKSPSAYSPLSATDEPNEVPDTFAVTQNQDPELTSRFKDALLEDDGVFGIVQTAVPVATPSTDEFSDAPVNGSTGFSLLDFIEQAITQAEASRQEFEGTFDGSRQGEFREFLTGVASEAGGAVRGFLQDNIAGVGRDLLSSAIEATGSDSLDAAAAPVLNIDYYTKSAEVLNGLLDALAQPIGSISLPQLGPLAANPLDELSDYAS